MSRYFPEVTGALAALHRDRIVLDGVVAKERSLRYQPGRWRPDRDPRSCTFEQFRPAPGGLAERTFPLE